MKQKISTIRGNFNTNFSQNPNLNPNPKTNWGKCPGQRNVPERSSQEGSIREEVKKEKIIRGSIREENVRRKVFEEKMF